MDLRASALAATNATRAMVFSSLGGQVSDERTRRFREQLCFGPRDEKLIALNQDTFQRREHIRPWVPAWLDQAQAGRCNETGALSLKDRTNNDCEFGEAGHWKLFLRRERNASAAWEKAAAACLLRCSTCPRCHFVSMSIEKQACMWSRGCSGQMKNSEHRRQLGRGFIWGFVKSRGAPLDYQTRCARDFIMRPAADLLAKPLQQGESDEILALTHRRNYYCPATSAHLINVLGTDRSPHGEMLPNDGLCARVGEQRAFEARCESTIRQMNISLRRLRFRSGLVFTVPGKSIWGLGHVLSIVYAMHFVCRRLRRYCYLSFYDMEVQRLFGYANGELWSPTDEELSRYGNGSKELKLSWKDPEWILELLRNETAPLLRVTLRGHLPTQSSTWLPHSMPLRFNRRLRQQRLDRCFCRYVSQPLFHPSEVDARAAATASVAYHLRTGFADVDDNVLNVTGAAPSLTSIAHWFKLACDFAVFSERTSFVFSDSPGLLTYLHRALPGLVRHNQQVASMKKPTRSWRARFEDKIPAALDTVLAGMVPEIEYSYLSSFAQPTMARSMCTWRATEIERRSCPRFTEVYVRDLYGQVSHEDHQRTMCIRWQLQAYHPCKNVISHMCQRKFVEATARVA